MCSPGSSRPVLRPEVAVMDNKDKPTTDQVQEDRPFKRTVFVALRRRLGHQSQGRVTVRFLTSNVDLWPSALGRKPKINDRYSASNRGVPRRFAH
jgi:hypothetical protein